MKTLMKIAVIVLILAGIIWFGFSRFQPSYPDLPVVKNVDLNKYAGTWYEVASFPQRFQKGCTGTTATYILKDGYVEVVNQCFKDSLNGERNSVKGKAFVVPNTGNAKLKVQFFWPFKGDYWIIDLDEKYTYAVVGHPNREYLWILSRAPKMDENIYRSIVERVKEKGFDAKKLKVTLQ